MNHSYLLCRVLVLKFQSFQIFLVTFSESDGRIKIKYYAAIIIILESCFHLEIPDRSDVLHHSYLVYTRDQRYVCLNERENNRIDEIVLRSEKNTDKYTRIL